MTKKLVIFLTVVLLILTVYVPCVAADEEEYILYVDNMENGKELISFSIDDNQKIVFLSGQFHDKWIIRYKDENGMDYNPEKTYIFPFPNFFPLEEKANVKKEIDIIFKDNSVKVLNEQYDIVKNCRVNIDSIEILDNNCIEKKISSGNNEEELTTTTTTTTCSSENSFSSMSGNTDCSEESSSITSKYSTKDNEKKISLSKFLLILMIVAALVFGGLFERFAIPVFQKLIQKAKNDEQKSDEDLTETSEITNKKKIKQKQKSQKGKFTIQSNPNNHTDIMGFPSENLDKEEFDNKEETSKIDNTKSNEEINNNDLQTPSDKKKAYFLEILNQIYRGEIELNAIEQLPVRFVTLSNSYNLNFSGQEKPKFKSGKNEDDYIIVNDKFLCLNFYNFREKSFVAYNDIRSLTNCFRVQKDGRDVSPNGQKIMEIKPGLVKKINDKEYVLLNKGEIIVET